MDRTPTETVNEKQQSSSKSNDSELGVKDDEQQSRILSLVEEWRPILGLNDWYIGCQFGKFENMATSECQPRYKRMVLMFNLERIESEAQGIDIVELVAHEMSHAFTWRIWEFCEKVISNYTVGHTHSTWKWLLEELHEECVTQIGNGLTSALRTCLDTSDDTTNLPNNGQETQQG